VLGQMGLVCASEADLEHEISCVKGAAAECQQAGSSSGRSTTSASGATLVDHDEIIFIGRRAARDQVDVHPAELSQWMNGTGGSSAESPHSNNTARHEVKASISRLVRSLVKGRSVTVSSVAEGTTFCLASLDRGLTKLTLSRRGVGDTPGRSRLRTIPLESVVEIVTDTVPGAARYSFGKCSVILRIAPKQEVLFLQLDSREECDTFVTCIGACCKQPLPMPPPPRRGHRARARWGPGGRPKLQSPAC